ncbi:MAG: UMP kinase [Candidatus Paceibacterota bacterium]
MSSESETIVISLGGSLIAPDTVDSDFVRQFVDLVSSFTDQGKRFFIITGGGKVARRYQEALSHIRSVENTELDWIGIHATRLNAQFLKMAFGDRAHSDILFDPEKEIVRPNEPITIGAGWKPGWSTDYVAVQFAKKFGARRVLNLSNVEYVYDKDPNEHADAVKIEKTDWARFRTLLPTTWDPGLSAPFDPIAAKAAEEFDLEVGILNGRIENVRDYFEGNNFVGTVIRNDGRV